MLRRIPSILAIAIAGLTIGLVASTPVQRGLQEKDAGKKADKKGKGKKGGEIQQFPVRLERLRRQLEYARPVDSERQTLLWHSGVYASKADRIWKSQQPCIADRTLAAAEAILHASDHLEHLTSTQGFPPPPLPPPAEEAGRHLAQVYFRTRETDFFLQEIHDSSASPLVTLVRQYYQRAIQSYDRSDFRSADEYGKTAEELVRAVENLAQAATLARQLRQ